MLEWGWFSLEGVIEKNFVGDDRETALRHRVLLCGTHKGARRIVRIYHHNNSCMIIDPRGIDLPAPMELHRKGTQGDRLQGAQMLEQGIRRRRDCDRIAGI